MYSIDETTESVDNRGGNGGLKPGINENVKLTSITYGPSGAKEGAPNALIFKFEGETGGTYEEKIFALDAERIKKNAVDYPKQHKADNKTKGYVKGKTITPTEAVEIAVSRFNAKIKHIASKFIAEEEVIIKANNFEDYSKQLINLLKGKLDVALRLKITYNAKNFYQLPFPPFIERMDAPAKMTINEQYDKIVKTEPDAEPQADISQLGAPNTNSLASSFPGSDLSGLSKTNDTLSDDLPF